MSEPPATQIDERIRMLRAQLTPLPNGPYRITGELELADADGRPVPALEPPVHLCRCDRSSNKPFCDGSRARTGWKGDE